MDIYNLMEGKIPLTKIPNIENKIAEAEKLNKKQLDFLYKYALYGAPITYIDNQIVGFDDEKITHKLGVFSVIKQRCPNVVEDFYHTDLFGPSGPQSTKSAYVCGTQYRFLIITEKGGVSLWRDIPFESINRLVSPEEVPIIGKRSSRFFRDKFKLIYYHKLLTGYTRRWITTWEIADPEIAPKLREYHLTEPKTTDWRLLYAQLSINPQFKEIIEREGKSGLLASISKALRSEIDARFPSSF